MANKKESKYKKLFNILYSQIDDLTKLSSSSLDEIIKTFKEARSLSKRRETIEHKQKEKEEKEKRELEEKKRKEQIELEKKKKKEMHIQEVTCMDLPLDWNNVFNSDIRTQGVHTDSISDALIMSLTTLGEVDIEYISSVTGETYKTVIETLKGSIYQNPNKWGECFYKGWETAEDYLSGNLMRKWKIAKTENDKYNGYFSDNIKAIEKVLPPTVATKDIYVTLGSPWVPTDIIDDFMEYLFGDPLNHLSYYNNEKEIRDSYKTIHDELTGTWEIPYKSRYNHSIGVRKTYGTDEIEALHIIEKTLNMKTITVTSEVRSFTNNSGKKRVINQAETIAALEKQNKIIKEFQDWVWTDENRKKRLETIFENNFSCVRKRMFDGSFLEFPGLSPTIKLYPYQKDAVARIIFTPNTLLAHDVGAGKTFVMIAAGQELRRMGLSKKNMYVVPNNLVGQWQNVFLNMYPNAKILCISPNNFTQPKRDGVLKQIRDNDYDGIIIAYSCFGQIPLSKDYRIEELEKKKKEILDFADKKGKTSLKSKKKIETIERAISNMLVSIDDVYNSICFDELGITRLFVDEAHNFKNVPIDTKITGVNGISKHGSKKCQDMMDKVHMIQKKNEGKGVVFATGTPISNSITDVYIMQKYLQSGEIAMLDLQNFDSWIGMFAEKTTEFEIDIDTNSYRLATRFAKFHNLPELTSLLSSIADFHQVDNKCEIPKFDGYSDAIIAKTYEFSMYLDDISNRADIVRSGNISRKEDNMLKITTDGRKAALDLRLVNPNIAFSYQSKVYRCAENVADIYFKTSNNQLAQVIFCDTSTPKAGFNIYSELKRILMNLGVPEEEIAFIHDAKTEAKRSLLFSKVRKGDIRILIGSTFKLGLGVNIQERLIAIHHIDVPWRPADMTQREGRILRQGNTCDQVYIYRYITEGSFDAYSWQLLETKQRFISSLLSGSLADRSGLDVENTILDYAEVKALAVGNPLIKKRVEANNELTRYLTLQRNYINSKIKLEKELLEIPGKINKQINNIEKCNKDISCYLSWKEANPPIEDNKLKKIEAENRKYLRELINSSVKDYILKPKEKLLMSYCGFNIILPANMTSENPFIWLVNNGRYYIELGNTEFGNLIRIDNFLDSFEKHLEKLKNNLNNLKEKEAEIKAELSRNENYSDEIELYRKQVEELDKELGVNKN